MYPSDKRPCVYASGAEKNRENDWTMRCPARVKSGAFVTTTAGEDETSLGNPENNKRDAVDIATTVPAPEKTKQTAEPAHENKAAAEPTTAEPTTSEPTTTELTTAEPARCVPVVQELGPSLTLGNSADVELSNVRPDRGPNEILSMGHRVRRDATDLAAGGILVYYD